MNVDAIGRIIAASNPESEHAVGQMVGTAVALAIPLNLECRTRFDYANYINLETQALAYIAAINEVAVMDIDEAKHMLSIIYPARCELAAGCAGDYTKWLSTPLITDVASSSVVGAIAAAIRG